MSTVRLRRETWCDFLWGTWTYDDSNPYIFDEAYFLHESAFFPRETSESTQDSAL